MPDTDSMLFVAMNANVGDTC